MARYIRNTIILAKLEAVPGTVETPVVGSNAILVSNVSINPLAANNVPRELVTGWMGGSEHLVGTSYVEMTFDVEVQGSGAAGTNPAWFPLLEACGFAVSNTVSTRSNAYLETPADGSVTIFYAIDGLRHRVKGARGTMSLKMNSGERPVFSFRFLGIHHDTMEIATGTPVYTAFKTPSVITNPNTGDLTFGCTFNLNTAAPALTGGTAYSSRGLELDLGNQVAHTPLLGDESIDIGQREVTGKIALDLTAAQEVTFMTAVKANTTQSIGLLHGTTAGYKVWIFMPAVQLINPRPEELNGRLLIGFDFRAVPSAGNDELAIVTA